MSAEYEVLLMKSIAADCGAQLLVAGNVVVGGGWVARAPTKYHTRRSNMPTKASRSMRMWKNIVEGQKFKFGGR